MFPSAPVSEVAANPVASVVDVREPDEFRTGHVPFSRNVPMSILFTSASFFDPEVTTWLVCLHGDRSSRACELLSAAGFKVVNIDGGVDAWRASDLPWCTCAAASHCDGPALDPASYL